MLLPNQPDSMYNTQTYTYQIMYNNTQTYTYQIRFSQEKNMDLRIKQQPKNQK